MARSDRPKRPAIHWARLHGVNAILLLGALICFAWFTRNALRVRAPTGDSGSAIATLRRGEAERKRYGTPSFESITPDAPLFNRDALWVPEGKSALIVYDDGSLMQAGEKTFLVIRRGMGQSGPGENGGTIQLLSGAVQLQASFSLFSKPEFAVEIPGGKTVRVVSSTGTQVKSTGETRGGPIRVTDASEALAESEQAPPTPGPAASVDPEFVEQDEPAPEDSAPGPDKSPAPRASQMAPRPNTLPAPGTLFFLVASKQAEVTFGWSPPSDGKFQVDDAQGKTVFEAPLKSARLVKHVFPLGSVYHWRVLGPSGQLLIGPYDFGVVKFDQKSLDEVLRNDPRRTIEVVE